eukprot:3104947-Pyramimonas_sp.AAC.1
MSAPRNAPLLFQSTDSFHALAITGLDCGAMSQLQTFMRFVELRPHWRSTWSNATPTGTRA